MTRTDNAQALATVLRHPAVWRAQQHMRQSMEGSQGISTGFAALDQVLPEAGWPISLTELLVNEMGAGELSLLTPALRTITAEGRGIALIGAPYLPQARAWQAAGIPLERLLVVDTVGLDVLWSAEQTLRSGECGAVLVWGQAAGRALNHRALQRLQLAASTGNAACFLYRSLDAETNPSPAPLRLRLTPHDGGLRVHFVKSRGTAQDKAVGVQTFPSHWQVANSQRATVAAISAGKAAVQPATLGCVTARAITRRPVASSCLQNTP
jgi:cell division inhibitor SulA